MARTEVLAREAVVGMLMVTRLTHEPTKQSSVRRARRGGVISRSGLAAEDRIEQRMFLFCRSHAMLR